MKLNFWQVLGAILLIVGLIYIVRREMAGPATPTTPAPSISVPAKTP